MASQKDVRFPYRSIRPAEQGLAPSHARVVVQLPKENVLFEFFLCLSRACLGKMIIFIYKCLKTYPLCINEACGGDRKNETRQPPKNFLHFLKRKPYFFEPFIHKKRSLCQDRLRTSIEKTRKTLPFSCRR